MKDRKPLCQDLEDTLPRETPKVFIPCEKSNNSTFTKFQSGPRPIITDPSFLVVVP